MKMTIAKKDGKKLIIPVGRLASGDWFHCEGCGRDAQLLVLGNTATCSVCGGRMVRM